MGKEKTIVKNIYYATISELIKQETYFETFGPILMEDIPIGVKRNKQYSFIMKDDVLQKSLIEIKKKWAM